MEKPKITKLSVGGKEYPCRVTMGAMVRFKNESGKDVSKLDQSDIGDLILFIYCCVQSACHADNVAFDMDFATFADNLDPERVGVFYDSATACEKKTQPPVAAK